MEKSVVHEVAQVSMGRPHVVLLGAGASRAAFPNGERNGRRLPTMADFLEIVPIREVLSAANIPFDGANFEELYASLAGDRQYAEICTALESEIFQYFSSLCLPATPTLYDHLLLSLRPKDIIATFNWDPFLIQAARRNGHMGGVPKLLFLHGNVLDAYCEKDKVHGVLGAKCSKCRFPFEPVGLLYPISEKDYDKHPAIRSSWEVVRWAFENAFMVTIFGYGAPQSDLAAVQLLLEAWGGWQKRNLEQFEVIDIRDEKDLIESWEPFIHTHHYEICTNFYDSWIANHPRRSGEAYWNQYMEACFIENNPIPRTNNFEELWSWYRPLLEAERSASNSPQWEK